MTIMKTYIMLEPVPLWVDIMVAISTYVHIVHIGIVHPKPRLYSNKRRDLRS